jgi:hypothetical protein
VIPKGRQDASRKVHQRGLSDLFIGGHQDLLCNVAGRQRLCDHFHGAAVQGTIENVLMISGQG